MGLEIFGALPALAGPAPLLSTGPSHNPSLLFANPSLLVARPHTSISLRSAQSRHKVRPKSAQSRHKVGPKSAKSRPKVDAKSTQRRPKVDPKSAQSRPKVGPKLAQSRPQSWPKVNQKSSQSRPKLSPAPPGLLHCCEEQTLITHCHISITSCSRTLGIEYFLRCPCPKPRCCDSNGSSSATPYPPRLGMPVEAKVSSRNLWWKDCCTWQCAIKDVRATGEPHNVFGLGRPGLPIPHFYQQGSGPARTPQALTFIGRALGRPDPSRKPSLLPTKPWACPATQPSFLSTELFTFIDEARPAWLRVPHF